MSRNTVTITDTTLSVEPHGLDKMWSYTSRLEFPLAHVRGATHDPGLRHEPKGWRGPGLQAGSKLSGPSTPTAPRSSGTSPVTRTPWSSPWRTSASRTSTSRSTTPPAWPHRSTPPSVPPRREPAAPSRQRARHRTPRHPSLSRAFVGWGTASSPDPRTRGARYDHPGPAVGATRARTGCGVGPGDTTRPDHPHTRRDRPASSRPTQPDCFSPTFFEDLQVRQQATPTNRTSGPMTPVAEPAFVHTATKGSGTRSSTAPTAAAKDFE